MKRTFTKLDEAREYIGYNEFENLVITSFDTMVEITNSQRRRISFFDGESVVNSDMYLGALECKSVCAHIIIPGKPCDDNEDAEAYNYRASALREIESIDPASQFIIEFNVHSPFLAGEAKK